MNQRILLLMLLWLLGVTAQGQPEEFYRKVDLIIWVVNNAESVAQGWKGIGFHQIEDHGTIPLSDLKYRGEPAQAEVRAITASLGGAKVLWIEPLQGNSAFSSFLKKNGNGVFALMHEVPLQADMGREIQRLNDLGVNTLQNGQIITGDHPLRMTIMKTAPKGKFALGFTHGADQAFEENGSNNELEMSFNQYAFAIRPSSVSKVSGYWEKLGFPPMEVTHGEVWDKQYYGEAANFDMELGWYRFGDIVYEWCIPLQPPTVYEDHIRKYGEGFQHFGFSVHDMDEAIAYFEDKGFRISMSGGWGEKGKPGSGRFAYVDTEEIGGETIELLWSYRE